jgi:hypothetical protein
MRLHWRLDGRWKMEDWRVTSFDFWLSKTKEVEKEEEEEEN